MKGHFKSLDLKNLFGQKRDQEENIVYPEDVNDSEELVNEDCYDLIKNGLNAGHVCWKKVFSNYTVEEIVSCASSDQEIIEALLGMDIKKDVSGQIRGKVSDINNCLFGMSVFNNEHYPAYKNFLLRNVDFFIDEALCLGDLYFIYKTQSTWQKLCGRLGEIVERFGWRETIKAFPALEDEVLNATLIELLNVNLNCTSGCDEGATELIQYMADVEKYRGVYFSVLHDEIDSIIETVPLFELPEIVRILVDELRYNEVSLLRLVINRIDLELDEICHDNVASELFLKWISMFEYGYDMMLNKLSLLLGTGAVELRTLRYLGVSDKLISECLLE